jgi:hypothetical protein
MSSLGFTTSRQSYKFHAVITVFNKEIISIKTNIFSCLLFIW